MNLRDALAIVHKNGAGFDVHADSVVRKAADGLVSLYDELELEGESPYSAADQCSDLYMLLGTVGLPVA